MLVPWQPEPYHKSIRTPRSLQLDEGTGQAMEHEMHFSEILAQRLPYLRRYARALAGSQQSGDAYVRLLLEAGLADDDLREELIKGRVPLYRAFTKIWSGGHVEMGHQDGAQAGQSALPDVRLGQIPPDHRQALLLVTLEDFTHAEAGRVLGIGASEVSALVARAVEEIEREGACEVLIIEDEPLIAMQLEELVVELGHSVVGTATTRMEAVEAFDRTSPSLMLVDIQLADGSSGIDAVEDILAKAPVPVIFITAYPERLLTGERPEPTYLVTKPFKEDTVRAAISQALFFGANVPTG